jgi:hypothetical protein
MEMSRKVSSMKLSNSGMATNSSITPTEITAEIRDNNDGTYVVSYCPQFHGPHTIVVMLVDEKNKRYPIQGSPFHVDIDPSPNGNLCLIRS